MYIATEPTWKAVNDTRHRDNRGILTNVMVHVTSYICQFRYDPIHVIECALTVIQACFTNDDKLCVDPVGIKASRETEKDGHNRIAYIASIFRTCEIGLQSGWRRQSWEITENFRWNARQVGRWNMRHFEIEMTVICQSKNQGGLTAA